MAEDDLLKRVMPHDLKAEKSVLGAMFLDNETIGQVSEILTGEDFYARQHGVIFDAIAQLYKQNAPAETEAE